MVSLVVIVILASYLLGSFSSGYFAGRIAGLDIRRNGSGNIGATNVLRLLGKKFGYTVFFFDAFKGFAAVWFAKAIASQNVVARPYGDWFAILSALACVLGHTFPVWLKFKGGKGVATSAGAMFGLAPWATLIAVIVWVTIFELTRYVSVASVAAAVALPSAIGIFLALGFSKSAIIFWAAVAIALVVCWRHRSNFARLLAGNEQRFERK